VRHRIGSILMTTLLTFVVMSGPCLPCAFLISNSGHGCCHGTQSCQGPIENALQECANVTIVLANADLAGTIVVEKPQTVALFSRFELPAALAAAEIPALPIVHDPPDLSLLNSVLTI
jgi:hypothetical protein